MNEIWINKPGNTTIIIVVVNTGSVHENDEYKGVSHFLEHMCFKGNPKRNQKQISSSIDNIGGDLNAFTDFEITAYWAKVGNSYKDLALEVITDLVTKPIIPEKEVNKEREVILQELKMYEDDPKRYVWDLFNEFLYASNSGLHLSTIGTRESLNKINEEYLKHYHNINYKNPTLIVIGDVENYNFKNNQLEERNINLTKVIPKNDYLLERNNLTQANILIGNSVKKISNFTPLMRKYCLYLLDAVYSDMSGRLFDVIREQNHLVYGVHFHSDIYSDGTIQWNVSAGLDKDKIEQARELIIEELSRPISKIDLEIALNKAIGVREMILDDIQNLGRIVAYSIITGIDYREIIYNYKTWLKCATNYVNEFMESMNFSNNLLVGIIPK